MSDAYVEFPTDRIVDVYWPPQGMTEFKLDWLVTPTDDYAEFEYKVMDVSTSDDLPLLSRTSLSVGTILVFKPPIPGPVPETKWDDQVGIEYFPDGATGTLGGSYDMSQFLNGNVSGGAGYSTTAIGKDRFGGANSVSISVVISLIPLVHGAPYTWFASTTVSIGSDIAEGFYQTLSGTAVSGATITLQATYDLKTPSLSLSAG